MRRRLNNKSIILIFIIALFTLLSYSFDQLVIRNEDKLRNSQIKLENYNVEIENYNSISNQLLALSDLTLNEFMNLKRNNKYWLKSIILNSKNKKNKILENKKINNLIQIDIDMSYLRFSQHLADIFYSHNNIANKYSSIYWYNKKVFTDDNFSIDLINVFDEIKNELKYKDLEIYTDIASQNSRDKIIYDLSLDHWYDVYKFGHSLINEIIRYQFYIELDSRKIDKLIERAEIERDHEILKISKISTNKNYYILSSIISQIFSLLFLLILFRLLIKY